MLADNYPFLNLVWTMFVFFAFVIWVALVIMVMIDNFKRTITAASRRPAGRSS